VKRKAPEKRKARGRSGNDGATAISVDKYNEMWAAYQERQSGLYVATRCGVSPPTARRYINDGDPSRGLKPLRKRFQEVQRDAALRADYTLAKATAATLRTTRTLKAVVANQARDLKAKGVHLDRPAQALRDLHAVEAAILGGASESLRIENAAAPNPLADLPDEDLLAFLELALPALQAYGFGAPAEAWAPPGGAPADPVITVH